MPTPEVTSQIKRLGLPQYVYHHRELPISHLVGTVFEIICYDTVQAEFPLPNFLVTSPGEMSDISHQVTQRRWSNWSMSYPDGLVFQRQGPDQLKLLKLVEYKVPNPDYLHRYQRQSDGHLNFLNFLRYQSTHNQKLTQFLATITHENISSIEVPPDVSIRYLIPRGTSTEGISDTLLGISTTDYVKLPISRWELVKLVKESAAGYRIK